MRVKCNRLATALGAEVVGMDLRNPDIAALEEMLTEHLVLVFRGQILSSGEHVALARSFGRVMRCDDPTVPFAPEVGDYPEILRMRGETGHNDQWHSDRTFHQPPLWLSILRAIECPPVGGDTLWINQYLAYERLSAAMRKMLSQLAAVHDSGSHEALEHFSAVHPVVRTIPETGRKCLYVNRGHTASLCDFHEHESDLILEYLFALADDPHLQFRHKWESGDVAIWDNRCTQHYAVNDYSEYRWTERVSVYEDVSH